MTHKEEGDKKITLEPQKLLKWYDKNRRVLPWRALPGEKPNPYHVWLSEMMLQQTTVATVGPYFLKFIHRWPRLEDLAKASLQDVLEMWAGLGYYRRARFLHACAQTVMKEYGGVFPRTERELLALPGLGPYTAAAMLAIAFDQSANVVDGNVERVMARVFNIHTPLPRGKKRMAEAAASVLPQKRFSDYAQALMDFGATVCTPQSPKCEQCPLRVSCVAYEKGAPEKLPKRERAKPKPVRRAVAFVVFDTKGRIFLRQRPEEGLLAQMMEVPSTPWEEKEAPSLKKAMDFAPFSAKWQFLDGFVHHTFTHFHFDCCVAVAKVPLKKKGLWVAQQDLKDQALPSVMHKIIKYALASKEKI